MEKKNNQITPTHLLLSINESCHSHWQGNRTLNQADKALSIRDNHPDLKTFSSYNKNEYKLLKRELYSHDEHSQNEHALFMQDFEGGGFRGRVCVGFKMRLGYEWS